MMSVKHILTVAAVLIAASMVRADMIPLSDRDVGSRCTTIVGSGCPVQPVPDDPVLFSCFVFADFERLSVGMLGDAQADVEHADPSQPVYVLTDKQDSLSLCLYALLSLGLCKAAAWVKIVSLCVVPACCHDGGAFQIGHSRVISPDCLCPAVTHCLVAPDTATEGPTSQYRREAIVCLWRKSLFTPVVLGSRAPPSDAHEFVSVKFMCTQSGGGQ